MTETHSEVNILTEDYCFSAMFEVFLSRELKNKLLSSIGFTKPIWESILGPWALGVVFELLKREKSGKRAFYCLFWPILYCSFDRMFVTALCFS